MRLVPIRALEPALIAEWRRLQESNPALGSPFFSPEYASCVDAVFGDAQVAVIRRDGAVVGVFPFQRGSFGRFGEQSAYANLAFRQLGAAVPLGGKLSDLQGLVCGPDERFDTRELLAKCGLTVWDFNRLLPEQTHFATTCGGTVPWHICDISGGYDAFIARQKATGSKLVSQTNMKGRRLERAAGPLRFVDGETDSSLIDTLLQWRMAKYPEAERNDGTRMAVTSAMLKQTMAVKSDEFAGQLSLLYAGDQLVAMHFGIRTKRVLNYWFAAYKEGFSEFSPGIILILRMLESAAQKGVARFDLGSGTERYKQQLKTETIALSHGSMHRPSLLKYFRDAKKRPVSTAAQPVEVAPQQQAA